MDNEDNSKELSIIDKKKESIAKLDNNTEELIDKIIEENDTDRLKELTAIFNTNIKKKSLMRTLTMSTLLDKVSEQALQRVMKTPDNFSNKDLIDYISTIQTAIDKSQKSLEDVTITQPIQVTKNDLTINAYNIDNEKVVDAVKELLKLYNTSEEVIVDDTINDNVSDNVNDTENELDKKEE